MDVCEICGATFIRTDDEMNVDGVAICSECAMYCSLGLEVALGEPLELPWTDDECPF